MVDDYPGGSKEFFNEKTGKWESFHERTERIAKEKEAERAQKWKEEFEAYKKAGLVPMTQKEKRALNQKKRQEEAELANLTRRDIRDRCNKDGECKANRKTLQNAFPEMISQIGGNMFRTNIDNKLFEEFLLANSLTFTLPDYVFKKRT